MCPPSNATGDNMMWSLDPEEEPSMTDVRPTSDELIAEEDKGTPVDKVEIASEIPIMPLKDTVIYPHIVAPLLVSEEHLVQLINDALAGDRIVGVVAAHQGVDDDKPPVPEDLYSVGSAVSVARMFRLPDGKMQLLVQGIARIKISEYTQTEPYLKAKIERLRDTVTEDVEMTGLARNALNLFQKIVNLAPYLPDEIFIAAMNVEDPADLSDFLGANINIDTSEKQELLEELDVKERLRKLTILLNREVEVLEIGSKIQDQVQSELSKGQREFYLREQLKAIQKELGELDEKSMEMNELKEKIDESGMPEEARKEA